MPTADVGTTDVTCASCRPMSIRPNKWRPENSAEIFNEYLDLTKSGGGNGGLDGISLVIWPETAVPFLLADSSRGADRHRRRTSGGHVLARRLWRSSSERDAKIVLVATRVYNSLLVIDDKGEMLGHYDKIISFPSASISRSKTFSSASASCNSSACAAASPRARVPPGRDSRRSTGEPADLLRDHLS